MNQRPVLMLNPRDDEAFGALVAQLVTGGIETTVALQAALRDRYPDAAVHLCEISSERAVVWYVYRDGRWIGPGVKGHQELDGHGHEIWTSADAQPGRWRPRDLNGRQGRRSSVALRVGSTAG